MNSVKVIKIGGSILDDMSILEHLFEGLKKIITPSGTIIVHGGGKAISAWLSKTGAGTEFIDGQRVTDDACMEIVEMVLSGLMNKEIVSLMNSLGIPAAGISGRDCSLMETVNKNTALKRVGEAGRIDITLLTALLENGIIPVLSPVSNDSKYRAVNVNADFFASAVAAAVGAEELISITDTGGVLKEGRLVEVIDRKNIEKFRTEGIISKGMLPKLVSAVEALQGGVKKVFLADYSGKKGTEVIL